MKYAIHPVAGRMPGHMNVLLAEADVSYEKLLEMEQANNEFPTTDVVLVLGSQNSSNSQRLAEISRQYGRPAYLIDGMRELRDEWFTGVGTVLVTAGASAPEENVQEVLDHLRTTFGATIETRTVREEHVTFPLPRELRSLPIAN